MIGLILTAIGVGSAVALAKNVAEESKPLPKPMEADVQIPAEATATPTQSTPPTADVLVEDTRAEVFDADDSWTPSPAKSTPVASPAPPKVLEDADDSWTPSPAKSTPVASPATPKVSKTPVASAKTTDLNKYNTDPTLKDPQTGLSLIGANISGKMVSKTADGGILTIGFDENYPFLNRTEILQFRKLANSYGVGESIKVYNGSFGGTGSRQFGGIDSFEGWLLEQTGFTRAQAGKGKLAAGLYTSRIYLLGKQKGLLNVETIKKYIQYRDKTVAEYKEQLQKQKERAAKPKPKVFAGKVLDENGNYVSPTSKESCPIGYKFLDAQGTKRCLTPERYEEIMVTRSRDVQLLPLRLTFWEGTRNGLKVTNSRLFSKYITFKEGQFNSLVKGYGLTSADSLKGLTDYFEHRGVFWGKKDGKWVALYEVEVQLNNEKKVRRYVVYNVTKDEYDYYKDVSKYYQIFLKNKGSK